MTTNRDDLAAIKVRHELRKSILADGAFFAFQEAKENHDDIATLLASLLSAQETVERLEGELAAAKAALKPSDCVRGKGDPPQDCEFPYCGCDPVIREVVGIVTEDAERTLSTARASAEAAVERVGELEAALTPIQKFLQKGLVRKRIGTPYYKMNQESRTPYAIWLTSLTECSNHDATLSDICKWYDAATAALSRPSETNALTPPLLWMADLQPMETAPQTGRRILLKSKSMGFVVAGCGWDNDAPEDKRWEVMNDIICTDAEGWCDCIPAITPPPQSGTGRALRTCPDCGQREDSVVYARCHDMGLGDVCPLIPRRKNS